MSFSSTCEPRLTRAEAQALEAHRQLESVLLTIREAERQGATETSLAYLRGMRDSLLALERIQGSPD